MISVQLSFQKDPFSLPMWAYANHTVTTTWAGQTGFFFERNNPMYHRSTSYRKHWNALIETYGGLCYYCQDEIAVVLDHIIPYSWEANNDIDNLVPACIFCNAIASDKIFDSLEHKRQYLLNRRKISKRAICTDCLLPFTYREHSPSMFLCALCYDAEYDTELSKEDRWHKWTALLRVVGIEPEAHQQAKKKAGVWKNDRKYLQQLITDYYSVFWVQE